MVAVLTDDSRPGKGVCLGSVFNFLSHGSSAGACQVTGTVLRGGRTQSYTHLSAHGVSSLEGRRWTHTDTVMKKLTLSVIGRDHGALAWAPIMVQPLTWGKLISVCLRALIHKI